MPVTKPYRRTNRQFLDGKYHSYYVTHERFAQSPLHFQRAYFLLQKDLLDLFDYIEPASSNLNTYSFRIHSLLLRACVEVEANLKAIMVENGFSPPRNLNMNIYKKVEISHRVSSYKVRVPYWNGQGNVRTPFEAWKTDESLPWYQAYNDIKHNRHNEFPNATFNHLLNACCGVLVLLSAQFYTHDFSPSDNFFLLESSNDEFETGIGKFFEVSFPLIGKKRIDMILIGTS